MEVGGADSSVGGQLTSIQEVVNRLPHLSWRPALLCDEMLPERFTLLSDQFAVDSPLLLLHTGVGRRARRSTLKSCTDALRCGSHHQTTGRMVCGGELTCAAQEGGRVLHAALSHTAPPLR